MSFYSSQQLSRQGPLRHLWTAAHLERQLKRPQIDATSIISSVEQLLSSLSADVPLALRLNGQLLLGLVRIYRKKLDYLQQDCQAVLDRVTTGAGNSAAAMAIKQQQQQQSDSDASDSAAAAAAVRNGIHTTATAAIGRHSHTLEADGLGFDIDMDDGLGFDSNDPTWGSQGFSDALRGSGVGGSSQQGFEGALQSQHLDSNQGLGNRLGALATAGSLGFCNGLDDELFDNFGEDAAAFDLTELEAHALRTVSAAAAASALVAAAAAAGLEAAAAAAGASNQETDESHGIKNVSSDSEQKQQQELEMLAVELDQAAAAAATLDNDVEQQQQQQPTGMDLAFNDSDVGQQLSESVETAAAAAHRDSDAGSHGGEEHSCHTPPHPSSDLQQQHTPQQQQQFAKLQSPEAKVAAAAVEHGDSDGQSLLLPFPALEDAAAAAIVAAAAPAAAAAASTSRLKAKGSLASLFGGLSRLKIDNDTRINRIPTELPGADIRAFLADRTPLLDSARFQVSALHNTLGCSTRHGSSSNAPAAAATAARVGMSAGQQLQLCYNTMLLGTLAEARAAAAAVNGGCYSCSRDVHQATTTVLERVLRTSSGSGGSCMYAGNMLQLALSSSNNMVSSAVLAAAGFSSVGESGFRPGDGDRLNPAVPCISGLGCRGPAGGFSSDLAQLLLNAATTLAAAAAPTAAATKFPRKKPRTSAAAADDDDDQQQQQQQHNDLHKQQHQQQQHQREQEQADSEQHQQQHDRQSSDGVMVDQFDQQHFDQELDSQQLQDEHISHHGSSNQQCSDDDVGDTRIEEQQQIGPTHDTGAAAAAAGTSSVRAIDASMGFTSNTREVLNKLKLLAAHAASPATAVTTTSAGDVASGKRKQPGSNTTGAAAASAVKFSALLGSFKTYGSSSRASRNHATAAAGSVSRLDASKALYEMLVLQNRGYVAIQQQGAYGELLIVPKEKLLTEVQQQQ